MNSATHVLVEKRGETPPLNPLALRTGTIHHRETRTSAMSWTHVRFETSVVSMEEDSWGGKGKEFRVTGKALEELI